MNKRKYLFRRFYDQFLDMSKSREEEQKTVESIRNGVEFKGANLWILVFATFMASLGLNVNSTAVIIGAMLISPLMGPIMGIGLSVGQRNFELMKLSLKNYFVATLFSVVTATIYFFFTPLNEVQSELLARTSPTIYDVFIAFMGGLAGIVALAAKEKGNVLPGVAIATALMPPLCTAGFGLATGNWLYFLGAFYLYFINSVFISLATFLGVHFMHFKHKEFSDPERGRKVKMYIIAVTVLTMCPAIYLTYDIVKETFYNSMATKYITEELHFPETQVLNREVSYDKREIHVALVGKEVEEDQLEAVRAKLTKYKLDGTKLVVFQGVNNDKMDIGNIKSLVMEDFYEKSESQLLKQKQELDSLHKVLEVYTKSGQADQQLAEEMKALFENVKSVSLARTVRLGVDSMKSDTLTYAILGCDEQVVLSEETLDKMAKWLKARSGAKTLKLIVE